MLKYTNMTRGFGLGAALITGCAFASSASAQEIVAKPSIDPACYVP